MSRDNWRSRERIQGVQGEGVGSKKHIRERREREREIVEKVNTNTPHRPFQI